MHLADRRRLRPQTGPDRKVSEPSLPGVVANTLPEAPPASVAVAPLEQPELPRRTPEVARLLEAGVVASHYLVPENGETKRVEVWKPLVINDERLMAEITQRLRQLDEFLAPAHRGSLLARILALLSHYRSEPNPPQVEQMIADDWADDLGDFPLWAVAEAARRWRRTKRFRPQISEIRETCQTLVKEAALERSRLREIRERNLAARNPLVAQVHALARSTFARVPI